MIIKGRVGMFLYLTFGITQCLIFLTTINYVFGYNINIKHPEMYSQGSGSGFGFSVAMYSINGSKSIIVGAPFESSGTNGSRDGAVYKCHNKECQPMNFNMDFRSRLTSMKEGLFGASVMAAENGLVVACAPRTQYHEKPFSIHDKEEIYMIGACFVYDGSQNKSLRPFTPCKPGTHGIMPEHFTCAAGFSVQPLDKKNSFIVGSLGSEYYSGEFIRMEKGARTRPDYGLRGNEHFDYMGYAVASGRFSGHELDVVAGSPRAAHHSGQVRIFRRRTTSGGGWEAVGETVQEEQFGSYFGAALAVGDFNGDGLDDLAIGAPFYTNTKAKIPNLGKVIVLYQLTQKTSTLRLFHSWNTTLFGTSTYGGNFGSSLATLKDVNQDGFEDLVVGEPYGGPRQRGVVYIYHGSPDGIRKQPAQIISAEDFNHGGQDLDGLGSSLAGDVDIDDNGYPDLAIGAHRSDQAVLLRTNPVVEVITQIDITPKVIVLEDKCHTKLPRGAVNCANVTTTMTYDGKSIPDNLALNITWRSDADNSTENLAFFRDSKSVISERRRFEKRQEETFTHVLFFGSDIVRYMKPIGVLVSYELLNPTDEPTDPIVNKLAPKYTRGEADVFRAPADVMITVNSTSENIVLVKDGETKIVIEVENLSSEPCYQIDITIESLPGISYSRSDSPNAVTCFVLEKENFKTVCDLGFSFEPKSKIIFSVFMAIENPEYLFNMSSIDFIFNLTSANDDNSANNEAEVNFPLITNSAVKVTGASDPDQLQMKNTSQRVTHVYEPANAGLSPLQHMDVLIWWPVSTSDEVPLLSYEDGPMVTNGNGHCHRDEHQLAPLPMRRLVPCQAHTPDLLCSVFHCVTSDGLNRGQQLVINMTGTVLPSIKVLSEKDNTLTLTSYIEVKGVDLRGEEVASSRTEISTSVVFLGVERKEKIATWIIVVAATCGFILLLIIGIIMWQCGFFKRKTKDSLYSVKRTSMESNWQDKDPRDRVGSAADEPEADDTGDSHSVVNDNGPADLNDNQKN